jgi:hypothetical protein
MTAADTWAAFTNPMGMIMAGGAVAIVWARRAAVRVSTAAAGGVVAHGLGVGRLRYPGEHTAAAVDIARYA